MHRLQRAMRAHDFLLEGVDRRERGRAAAFQLRLVLDPSEELGKIPPDRFDLGKTRVGSIDLLDQFGDAVFQLPRRHKPAALQLKSSDLVIQFPDDVFEVVRVLSLPTWLRSVPHGGDALLKQSEAVDAARLHDPVQISTQLLEFAIDLGRSPLLATLEVVRRSIGSDVVVSRSLWHVAPDRRRLSIERTLAVGDFKQRLV